jgi:hypothetical protein
MDAAMTREFHKIWLKQCDAAEGIDANARELLLGEPA